MATFRVLRRAEVLRRRLIEVEREQARTLFSVGALATEPTAALAAEMRARGFAVLDPQEERRLPGLMLQAGCWVVWRGRGVGTTAREGAVLSVLMAAWPRPVPALVLQRAVWGGGEPLDTRTYVGCLRRKLPGLIETVVPGGGYRLRLDAEASS